MENLLEGRMQKHMMFVKGDPDLRANYTELFTDEGFQVAAFADRPSALRHAQQRLPDLALLDISLQGERDGGFQLCADLRSMAPQLPIVFLTAQASEADKISGIRLGADDYLTRDVSVDFLMVRIEALLRRFQTLTASIGSEQDDLRIDEELQTLYWQQRKVDLSLVQFWIVKALANQPGQPKNPGQLMRAANLYVEPNTIAAHIKTIRKRFRAIDPTFNCIRTERGIGYRWQIA